MFIFENVIRFSFCFFFSTSIDGDRTQQQQQHQHQQPNNDIYFSNSSSFIRNLSDKRRSEPYVLCQIFSDGQPLCMPVQTSYKSFNDKWKYVNIYFILFFSINNSFLFLLFYKVGMNG